MVDSGVSLSQHRNQPVSLTAHLQPPNRAGYLSEPHQKHDGFDTFDQPGMSRNLTRPPRAGLISGNRIYSDRF